MGVELVVDAHHQVEEVLAGADAGATQPLVTNQLNLGIGVLNNVGTAAQV